MRALLTDHKSNVEHALQVGSAKERLDAAVNKLVTRSPLLAAIGPDLLGFALLSAMAMRPDATKEDKDLAHDVLCAKLDDLIA